VPDDSSDNVPKRSIGSAKHELFSLLLEEHGISRARRRKIEPTSLGDNPPLSFGQEQLWFLNELQPGSPVYNISKVHCLRGYLDVDALTQSLNEIIRRHAVLRTTFASASERPVQVIAPSVHLDVPVLDLRELPVQDRKTEGSRIVFAQAEKTFDLLRGPLIRVVLLRMDEEEWLLFLSLHQIVCDGHSVSLLYRELEALYGRFHLGQEPTLAELIIQYGDYARWQRNELQEDRLRSLLDYWQARFAAPPLLLNLPTDRARPKVQSFRGSRWSLAITRRLTTALKEFSRKENASLFVILLATFATLLRHYSEQEDIVVGAPVANRYQPELQQLIGFFVNTLALRLDLTGNPSFRDLVLRVRTICHEAFAHGDLPFEKLVEAAVQTRDLGRNPLFHIMFAMQELGAEELSLLGLQTEPSLEVENGTAKFDLTLSLQESNQHLVGSIEYSADLFKPDTIERMVGHYQTLLKEVSANPDRRISDYPILTAAESKQLLIEWNDTAGEYPKSKCIHELIEEQTEISADAIAVTFQEQQLTYRKLNARANQLAWHLITLGMGPGRLAGIYFDRSLDMLVGVLAILKAGAGYVPLDPTYPKERLAFMLEDANVSVVVTQEKLIRSCELSGISAEPVYVCLDRDCASIEACSNQNPDVPLTSDNLAYVIYTSGSTGKPKGVQVLHRSIVNCLHSMAERLGFTKRDVLLAVTTISFDIAALEIYLPLLFGGSVAVAAREEAGDGSELLRRLRESSATAMQATPSTWDLLIEAGWRGSQTFKILCGGEPMSRELADALLVRGNVWNLYGPTESTIWCTIHKVKSGDGAVPIGRPIANTQSYILDPHLQPVPIGVQGELYIGGGGLARGYWNQPELTAEKFIPHPFVKGERLYNTGDRARYLADGNIEFLGRLDNQVKVRGHRVELGEIEAALNQHPAVKTSLVIAHSDLSENLKFKIENTKSLIAYVVAKQQAAPSVGELRGYLKEKLPEFMIPSTFVIIENLPLTPNGKIDRNALPQTGGARLELDREIVTPRTEIEEMVAQVWRELLRVDLVGVHDNFFDLGGHSLLATRVVGRLRNTFAVDLALRTLFELPTVAGLANHIKMLRQDQSGTRISPIVAIPRHRPIPASFSQQRLWLLREIDPGSTAYNIPAAFFIRGPFDVHAFEAALNTIVARHEILRTTFGWVDGGLVQEIRPSLGLELSSAEFAELSPDSRHAAVREIALREARKPFDLRNGPLLRAEILRTEQDKHYLLLNFDHIALDGSSMVVLYKELGILYEAFINGQANPLPPLALQYGDYALWQRDVLDGDLLTSELEYWKRQLADLTPLSIPADYPRPAMQTSRGVRKCLSLSKELADSLKELSRREGVTVFMTLLAAFQLLLSRYSGQDNVVVGSTIAGRSRAEIEGLIGFFVNALPLRTDLSGNPTFLELLKRVREVCLGAYTHQDAPFERIVEAINPRRDLSRNPLFQIMFNMADLTERVLQLAGCEVQKESFFDPEAKFDITLYAPERDGAIELALVYNADLFSESRISIMLEQLRCLLSQIAERPEPSIAEYTLLLPSMPPQMPDPTEPLDDTWQGPIYEYVAQWAERAGDRLAAIDWEETWTYREIDICSNQLANYMVAQGIKPKDVVAIYAQRSSELIIALLGILKAGAAFVVLDPAYPSARLTAYLRISESRGWIRMEAAGQLPEELATCLETLNLSFRLNLPRGKGALLDLVSQRPDIAPGVIVGSNDPAYVAFTSGSTGEPKGVLSRHGPITHFLPWQKEAFDLFETDRFCLLSGLAYNHLHRDIFTALYLGATLYVPPPNIVREPAQLTEWLRMNGVSVLHLTPALGQLLLAAADQPLVAVRRVFFGGDVLTRGEVARIRALAPNATIGCFYGATETQRAVGYYDIPRDFTLTNIDANRPVPLGKGIKDVQLLLLNKSWQLAGVGELGELYVRSPHLAAGYVGDENLTSEKFVANPFTNDPYDRLYRTGELGRYLPDGNVEWAGRTDRRVNIRGFRVELEEIESVLKQHAAVNDAAVVIQDVEISCPEISKSATPVVEDSDNLKSKIENPKSDRRLIAYVAADEPSFSTADLLHRYLSTRLPDYMMPAHFEVLAQLPLNPNGKVDYRALPPVHEILFQPSSSSFAPRNEVEAKLAIIFCQVLGRKQVGIDENFFRLGGHSLLAAHAAAHIRDAVGVWLELRTFLKFPTVAALANEIAVRLKPADAAPGIGEIDREEIEL
jgi:amino acid adenylation domain-containing protein